MGDSLELFCAGEFQSNLAVALGRLRARERPLLDAGVNERSLTHRLATYIAEQFPGWDVDAEYNRNIGEIKRLWMCVGGAVDPSDTTGRSVLPDIIVHRRGKAENYLVIEVKKVSNPGHAADICKLKQFTTPAAGGGLGYEWAHSWSSMETVLEASAGSVTARQLKTRSRPRE